MTALAGAPSSSGQPAALRLSIAVGFAPSGARSRATLGGASSGRSPSGVQLALRRPHQLARVDDGGFYGPVAVWRGTLFDVSTDTKWIIGTVVGAGVAMTGVVVSVMAILIGGVNVRIGRLETDVRSMDDRLRAVAIAFGKVDQRLETLERAILPAASPPAD